MTAESSSPQGPLEIPGFVFLVVDHKSRRAAFWKPKHLYSNKTKKQQQQINEDF